MKMIKFQEPYILQGHLQSFVEKDITVKERDDLLEGATPMKEENGGDEPGWMKDRYFRLIRTIYKAGRGGGIIPSTAYIVEHNGNYFVIGSRSDKEKPQVVPLAPDELFEI